MNHHCVDFLNSFGENNLLTATFKWTIAIASLDGNVIFNWMKIEPFGF